MTNSKFKVCNLCNENLPTENFHKNKATKDGLHTICKPCNTTKATKWKRDNPEKAKDQQYQRKYGISYSDYEYLLSKQDKKCDICDTRFEDAQRGILFVDHCHKTGKIRGLLCQNCNTAIGLLQDDPSLCVKAEKYLLKSRDTDA